MLTIVGLLKAWELSVEALQENSPPAVRPVIDRVLGEIGGLGFVGLFLEVVLGRLTKNEYPTKNLKSTSRLLVGCHTQASGYFWPGITTVLGFGGPPMTNEPMIP